MAVNNGRGMSSGGDEVLSQMFGGLGIGAGSAAGASAGGRGAGTVYSIGGPTKVFHQPNCKHVKNRNPATLRSFDNERAAARAGLRQCMRCAPGDLSAATPVSTLRRGDVNSWFITEAAGRRYHRASCDCLLEWNSKLSRWGLHDDVYCFGDEAAAIAGGFVPCGSCYREP